MTTAFVLSGGANLGSVQVGMAMALEEADVKPDLIVATSVGALNGAWLACGHPAKDLAAVWTGIDRSDLFPLRPLGGLLAFLGRRNHFVSNSGLRKVIEKNANFENLEDAQIPIQVIATDVLSGEEVVLDSGPTVDAILASSALPAVFPPIEIGGRILFDGGVANNTPISRAIDAGATEVWVLSPGYACALIEAPKGAIEMGLHSIALLVQQRLAIEVASREYSVPVHLIPPPCPITVAPTDFSQTEELIEQARELTRLWLETGMPNALPLATHEPSA